MNKSEIKIKYEELLPLYQRLGENVKQALIQFLDYSKIDYLDVEFRTKDFESFYKKIERKNYKNPFEEIQDICGLRIINYYQSDLDMVTDIIRKEFNVIESVDKQDELDDDRFGYRSYHYIVSLKKEWLKAPNYRGLSKLNFEIQARTILMHGWAAINHKLLYKHEKDIPKPFKRDLFRLSALIELADEQFERLRIERQEYTKEIIEKEKDGKLIIDSTENLNVDSVQALLDFYFPTRTKGGTSAIVEEISNHGLSLSKFNENVLKALPYLESIEAEESEAFGDIVNWAQQGVARTILDLTIDKYTNDRGAPDEIVFIMEKYRDIINS